MGLLAFWNVMNKFVWHKWLLLNCAHEFGIFKLHLDTVALFWQCFIFKYFVIVAGSMLSTAYNSLHKKRCHVHKQCLSYFCLPLHCFFPAFSGKMEFPSRSLLLHLLIYFYFVAAFVHDFQFCFSFALSNMFFFPAVTQTKGLRLTASVVAHQMRIYTISTYVPDPCKSDFKASACWMLLPYPSHIQHLAARHWFPTAIPTSPKYTSTSGWSRSTQMNELLRRRWRIWALQMLIQIIVHSWTAEAY